MRTLFVLLLSLAISTVVQAKVVGKEVTYKADGVELKGYLAYDNSSKAKRPGVLVVHEWWGHNDYARKRARMLAKLGYIAFALDMYGEGKQAAHPQDAGKFAGEVRKNLPMATARFKAAMDQLQNHPLFDKGKMAAIGYCFGGAVVLEMARSGMELQGVASFHGSLGTAQPAETGKVKAKVLVMNGGADPFVKEEEIAAFKTEMSQAGVDFNFISYPGAKHSFTNPGANKFGKKFKLPLEYNKQADKKSWRELQAFLKKIFN
ncbi:MAG: dienelactone hydrolase family protein [Gammaproteobacteria bacterium]|nr:dienelactone hydrolase family protein [Gammaproteobacteria bacterium]